MRAAIVSTFDIRGGAAIATYRLHRALRKSGAESRMFVASKDSRDPSVIGRDTWFGDGITKLRTTLDNLPLRRYPNRRGLFSAAWLPDRLAAALRPFQPDLVHLFWVTGGMIRIESLKRVNQPIVWTLHDMWPFTGGCHYDNDCGRYSNACGRCPVLRSGKEDDLSRAILRRKRAAWMGKNITVVATSKWLGDCAASSALFSKCRVEVIPNCVDTLKYQALEKAAARRLFGLDVNAKTILFSGGSAHKDPRKGLAHLFDALQILGQNDFAPDVAQLVLLGIPDDATLPSCPFPVVRISHLYDELSQVALYNAADVLAAPSMQENLSNVVVEAVCCGTPAVGFAVGGNPDIIAPGETGYLARPFSARSLAEGLATVLRSSPDQAADFSRRCRQLAASRYAEKVVARRYIDLYSDVMCMSATSNARALR